jgi:hypothetical protein
MTLPLPPPQGLSPAELRRLVWASRLPRAWILTPRRRRLLVVGLAGPGFLLVATTPVHQALALLVVGAILFAAALVFRGRTEPAFVRAEAADLWPPLSP